MKKYLIISLLLSAALLLSMHTERVMSAQVTSASATGNGYQIRAQLRARQQTVLSAPLSARIVSLPVEEGMPVKQGDLLFKLECAEHQAGLAIGQARENAAKARLDTALRLRALDSGSELDVALGRAEMAAAAAEINRFRAILVKCDVKAPFNGRIATRLAMPYQYMAEGEPVLEIVGSGEREVEMVVPAAWLSWLRPETKFRFVLDATNQHATGYVHQLGARVDPVSQTLRVIGLLDSKEDHLLPGLSGLVIFEHDSPQPN